MLDKPIHIILYIWPCFISRGRILCEEGEHMRVDQINRIEHVLSPPTHHVPGCHLAHCDGDMEVREPTLGFLHFRGEIFGGYGIVKKRL